MPGAASAPTTPGEPARGAENAVAISDELEQWLAAEGDHTLGALVEVFEEKSFALLFIVLLGVSALPIPTGGATHVFDVVAVLAAAQLVIGRDEIWIPRRWRGLSLGGDKQRRFLTALLKFMRFLERFSRPRLSFLFGGRISNGLFGLVVIAFTTGAFFAPPFSWLDTLPGLGVVLVSMGVLMEDALLVAFGLVAGVGGIVLEITVGKAAADAIRGLF